MPHVHIINSSATSNCANVTIDGGNCVPQSYSHSWVSDFTCAFPLSSGNEYDGRWDPCNFVCAASGTILT